MAKPDLAIANKELIDAYLDLIRKCITKTMDPERYTLVPARMLQPETRESLEQEGLHLVFKSPESSWREGTDWPLNAETMIGEKRLANVRFCVEEIIRNDVPGDLIETGVWRGGSVIYMAAILKAYGVADRTIWVADSFKGLPKPNAEKYPADTNSNFWENPELAVSAETVKNNIARYGLLGDRVKFLEGWFSETLPSAPIEKLAVMRLDGDMYESTMDGLRALYPKLSPGGFAIMDDYNGIAACRAAVDDYRNEHGVAEPMISIDGFGAYWQKATV
jgi:O-methyltransferase